VPTRWNRWFVFADLVCSKCFGHHYAHHQELKSTILQMVAACIILLSSWWWALWCPKHVEQAIRSAKKKTSVASSWHFISTY